MSHMFKVAAHVTLNDRETEASERGEGIIYDHLLADYYEERIFYAVQTSARVRVKFESRQQ